MKRWVGCIKISVWVWLILFGNAVHAKYLGAYGAIYEIQEQDALEWIVQKLGALQASGALEQQQMKMKEQALSSIMRPKSVAGLRNTDKPRTTFQDLTLSVPYDILGLDGVVIHKRGARVNPLDLMHTPKALLFLDGEDKGQIEWALREYDNRNGLAKLVLVNGPIIELMQIHELSFFFDQSGRLVKKFNIEQVPAIVEQKGNRLMISEVMP